MSDEKETLHGNPFGYGKGIKGDDEKKQKKAFDRNKKKAEKGDKSAYEPTAIDKKVMKKREKGDMPDAKKSKYTEDCWPGYKAVGLKDKNGKKVPNCVPEGKKTYSDMTEDSDKALANRHDSTSMGNGSCQLVHQGWTST